MLFFLPLLCCLLLKDTCALTKEVNVTTEPLNPLIFVACPVTIQGQHEGGRSACFPPTYISCHVEGNLPRKKEAAEKWICRAQEILQAFSPNLKIRWIRKTTLTHLIFCFTIAYNFSFCYQASSANMKLKSVTCNTPQTAVNTIVICYTQIPPFHSRSVTCQANLQQFVSVQNRQ